jgi:hypothetical protein
MGRMLVVVGLLSALFVADPQWFLSHVAPQASFIGYRITSIVDALPGLRR